VKTKFAAPNLDNMSYGIRIEYLPFDIVNAGDHCDLKISKQILPLLLIFGWYIFVVKAT
jgi:hypothetical protein